MVEFEEILLVENASILLIETRKITDVIICAPHHAPGGVISLPCKEHPQSDENAGIIARKVAEKLNASSIIACNYHIDVNKNLGTDYSLQIAKWKPIFLIEIHGHSGERIGRCNLGKTKDEAKRGIEISSGSADQNRLSIEFARILQKKLSENPELKTLTTCGDFNNIHYTARSTATITSGNWKALHIELPPMLRKNGNELPEIANGFIDILVETIKEVCQ
jgi:hypothetical protein